jgi:hypothetical protein
MARPYSVLPLPLLAGGGWEGVAFAARRVRIVVACDERGVMSAEVRR